MPIAKLTNLPQNAAWGMWHITETTEELWHLLPAMERKQLDQLNITNEQRKKEWMAGRLVSQSLTEHLQFPYSGIKKDEYGKPHLKDQLVHINLSHSYPYAVAVAHPDYAVGIDIERIREKLGRLCPKFLSNDELAHASGELEKLCLYWTAKETLYKLYGKRKLIFKENIIIEPFDLHTEGKIDGAILVQNVKKHYTLYYHRFKNFYISFCIAQ